MKNTKNGLPAGPFPSSSSALRFLQWYRSYHFLRHKSQLTKKPWKMMFKQLQAIQIRSVLRGRKRTKSIVDKIDELDTQLGSVIVDNNSGGSEDNKIKAN